MHKIFSSQVSSIRLHITSSYDRQPFFLDNYPNQNMALPSKASTFTIVHRAENGEPDFRFSINDADQPNMATCIGQCIKRCQAMLKKEEVLRAFGSMATSWTETIPKGNDLWYCQGERTNKKMQDVAENFCEIIKNRFPVVFVDNSLHSPHSPHQYGHHWSRKWGGMESLTPPQEHLYSWTQGRPSIGSSIEGCSKLLHR